MCLIITAIAAIITTLVWYFKLPEKAYMLSKLVLMYWGASIMWTVDGIYRIAEGEGFFELTLNDAMLGVVVVVSGAIAWVVMLLAKDPKKQVLGNEGTISKAN